MSGSVAATFVVLFAGLAAVSVLLAVRQYNRGSSERAEIIQLRADVADQTASIARLEGENIRLRAEITTLKDLATGRTDIKDLTQEIRTMVWMAYGPHEEAQRRVQRPPAARGSAETE
jgi:cell division protein FtsB